MNLVLASKILVEGCKCKEVTSAEIKNHNNGTIKYMTNFMKSKHGIGLAAPQVGIFKRFFIMKYGNDYIYCANPKILYSSPQKSSMKESCLTYPGPTISGCKPFNTMMRPKTIKVEFQNSSGDIQILKLRGTEAKCFQHELDHLNGLTIFYRGK